MTCKTCYYRVIKENGYYCCIRKKFVLASDSCEKYKEAGYIVIVPDSFPIPNLPESARWIVPDYMPESWTKENG